jgi:sulfur relay (sulfurtransferase) complex TusBCD TusD component (DsrE family)
MSQKTVFKHACSWRWGQYTRLKRRSACTRLHITMSQKSVIFKHACSWWWRPYTPLKRRSTSRRLQDTMSQKSLQTRMFMKLEAVYASETPGCMYESTYHHIPGGCHFQVGIFLMMEAVYISETSVYMYETKSHRVPEDCHLQTRMFLMMEAVYISETSSTCTRLKVTVFQKTVIFKHACSWWWRHYTALKRRYACTRLHIVMSQKTVIYKHACFWWWRLCALLKRRRTSARLHGTMPLAYSPPRELEISQQVSYCRIPAVYWALKFSTV